MSNSLHDRKLILVRRYDVPDDFVFRIIPPKVWLNNNAEGQTLAGLDVFEDADTHELVVRKILSESPREGSE